MTEPDDRPRCPTCRKPLPPGGPGATPNPHVPFCSERCRMVDLGRWLDGEYRIPGPEARPDLVGE